MWSSNTREDVSVIHETAPFALDSMVQSESVRIGIGVSDFEKSYSGWTEQALEAFSIL